MDNGFYASLTRQSGLLREMQTVANNIANMSTTGFRREGVIFSELVHDAGPGLDLLVLHDDENAAAEAGQAFVEAHGGRLVELRNDHVDGENPDEDRA